MNKLVEKKIREIYNSVWKKIFTKKEYLALSKGDYTSIESKILLLKSSEKYDEFANKFAKELAKYGLNNKRGIWRKFFEASKRLNNIALPINYNEYERLQMKKAIEHNKLMIKTIPDKLMEVINHKYTEVLINQVAKGTLPRSSFQNELIKHGVTNAKVIARTETAKLQTAITENRAKDLGSIAYTWISSNDKRTRPSHREMNRVIVFWRNDSQKPLLDNMRGNAGEFPNCRCDCEPLFDESDLDKSNYRVYDYRIDKIINMTKQELLKVLEKGEL